MVFVSASVSVASVHAAEAERSEARAFADQGADAYARGDFARAHELFSKAYALVPAPTIALFEARTLAQLGRLVEARGAYFRASSALLSSDAPQSHRDAVRDAGAELVALDRRIPRYQVVVEKDAGSVTAGSVTVDGRRLPSLQAWMQADPGAHELRFGDENGKVSSLRFELREGETKTLRIDGDRGSANPARTLGFVSLGVGAAGLVVGVSAGLVAVNAHRDAERNCTNGICVPGSSGADALERFEDYRTVSTVGYAVGAIGAVAGTILIVASPDASKPRVALRTSLRDVKLEAKF